jgi:hypothetical protein
MKRRGLQRDKRRVPGTTRARFLSGVSAGRLGMRLLKLCAVMTLMLCASGIARADDTQLNVNGGGVGSPTLLSHDTLTAPTGTQAFFFLAPQDVTRIILTISAADVILPFRCGFSNSFFIANTSPSVDGGGNYVCDYEAQQANPADAGESLSTLQFDCSQTNQGFMADADDCIGIAAGGEVQIDIIGGKAPATFTYASNVPEPATLSLVLMGLAGMPFVRRRLRRNAS